MIRSEVLPRVKKDPKFKLDDVMVGRRLAWARGALGLRKVDVARAIGMGPPNYGNIENGQRRVSTEQYLGLLTLYGIRPDFLMLGEITGLPEHLRSKAISDAEFSELARKYEGQADG